MAKSRYKNLTLSKFIGCNIKILRHNKRWPLKEFADRLEMSISGITRIEFGVIDISLSRIHQIASIFEILTYLFRNRPNETCELNF
jgi:transcriptional regulator with XRE-family HTH domain